ncbi:MAG: Holliday junction branch migration protein RuvA [Cyanobacteria bacterium DS2.3.42]|nr:Holliday junction branch migration protein RuvA [Cyanobacteria bacterium DS2.3.42]
MLAYLKGEIREKELTSGQTDRMVLDVGGIGFEVMVSKRTLLTQGAVGERTIMPVSLIIRETEWTLFGFGNQDERELFTILQTVTGIGPKLALAVVGTLGVQQIVDAVLSENQKLISQAPGVGAKVAQRIILELKTKIEEWVNRKGIGASTDEKAVSKVEEEVEAILEGLGYTATEINMTLKKAREEAAIEDVEELVRFSLKVLGSHQLT